MKTSIKLSLAVLAGLAVLPVSAAAAPGNNGVDRANAARACKALKASQPALFAQTYGTQANAHGKCVTEWVKTANEARRAAAAACRAANLRGNALARCLAARTNQQLTARIRAQQNAALACKTLRDSMGATNFANEYGTNRNKANAFGKCVSSMRSQGAQAGRVTAVLSGPVGSGSFAGVLNARQGRLCYTLATTGLTDITAAHIHVKPSGAIVVPLATPTTGSASGCVTVDAALLRAILQTPGNYYVNVHTAAAPAGAISGDLRR
jgi:hypothetical protein